MAAHESARTTGLYDRRDDDISLDGVERILIEDSGNCPYGCPTDRLPFCSCLVSSVSAQANSRK